jgi:hypothetical protein
MIMKVRIIKDYRDHRAGTEEDCTGGQADLLVNLMQIAEVVEPEKPKSKQKKQKCEQP